MDFTFTPEQEELRRTVRQFLEKTSPEAEVRRVMATERGYDPGTWRRMAEELGLLGMAIPEAYGGAGAGFTELGLVAQEMGRALLCGPFLATAVLAAGILLESDDEDARRRWLPADRGGRPDRHARHPRRAGRGTGSTSTGSTSTGSATTGRAGPWAG